MMKASTVTFFTSFFAKTHETFVPSSLLYVLDTSEFSQTRVKEKERLKEIRVYADYRVIGINQEGEAIEIEGLTGKFPTAVSAKELKKYFEHHSIELSQFSDGSYRCVSHTRLLGGGAVGSRMHSLMQAVKEGDVAKVETLMNPKNINTTDKDNRQTLLMLAASLGHTEIVRMFLDAGAYIHLRDNNDWTALHHACGVKDNAQVVDLLLKAGANVNSQTNTKKTPVILATSRGYIEILELLLKAGGDVNLVDEWDQTALYFACRAHPEIMRLLIEAGANVNIPSRSKKTPLMDSVNNVLGDIPCVKLLLEAGADVNPVDDDGQTALHLACSSPRNLGGVSEIVDLLIQAGADVNVRDNTKRTPLMNLASKRIEDTESVKLLLKAGADSKARNREGKTALELACKNKHSEIITLLDLSSENSIINTITTSFLIYILRHPKIEPAVTDANRENFLKEGIKLFQASRYWPKFQSALISQTDYQTTVYNKFKDQVKRSIADFGIKVHPTHIEFYADELRQAFDCTVLEVEKELNAASVGSGRSAVQGSATSQMVHSPHPEQPSASAMIGRAAGAAAAREVTSSVVRALLPF